MSRLALTLAALLVASGPAQAHTGIGGTLGLAQGFGHPIGGIDHLLVMVAVGLFAAHLGGRALWLVPLSFISAMAIGGAFGITGIFLPSVEVGIALSVVVFGVSVAARPHLPTLVAMTLAGFFALFHGQAHGAEMPEATSGLAYGVGFVLGNGFPACRRDRCRDDDRQGTSCFRKPGAASRRRRDGAGRRRDPHRLFVIPRNRRQAASRPPNCSAKFRASLARGKAMQTL